MDDILMGFFIIVMPIFSVLLAEWRLKRATSNMLKNTMKSEETKEFIQGITSNAMQSLKEDAKEFMLKPEFPALLQGVGAQLAQGMMTVGSKEVGTQIKAAIPKFKLNDIMGIVAMKMLGGGNLADLLGQGQEPGQAQPSNNGKGYSKFG